MKQQAVDVRYQKIDGTLLLDELNQLLANGWEVATDPVMSGGGDLLVIVQKKEENENNG